MEKRRIHGRAQAEFTREDSTGGTETHRRKGAETGGKDQASFSDSAPDDTRWIGRTLAGWTR